MIDRGKECSVTMSADEWNVVLSILREAPYRTVAPLIERIIAHCMRADEHSATDAG
jgi:hypothetical protein